MVGDEGQYFQNCWQLRTTCSYFFYLSIDGNINKLEYSDSFFVLFTVLICSDSIFNLLKRVTEGSFLFLCKKVSFPFSNFLEFGCPN